MNKILAFRALRNFQFRSLIPGFFILLLACKNSESVDSQLQKFTYTIDTLRIESGDHLLSVATGIPKAKLSKDERYLFYYDYNAHSIEKIDLENAAWVTTLDMDKEGPKGVMDRSRFDFIPLTDSSFRIYTKKTFKDFSISNELLNSSLPLDSLIEIPEKLEIQNSGQISSDLKFLYGLTSDFRQEQKLVWIDLEDYSLQETGIDSMDYRENFKIILDGMSVSGMIASTFSNERIYVYHSDGIDAYEVDPKSGEKRFIDNQPQITPKRKEGKFPKQAQKSELAKVLELKNLEVYYHDLVYDKINQGFYRIATRKTENKGRTQVYQLIFDQELNLISEVDLTDLGIDNLANYFVRKGRIYLQNKETDELEFFVFDLKPIGD